MTDGILSRAPARIDRGTGTRGGHRCIRYRCRFQLKEDNRGDGERAAEKEALHNEPSFHTDQVRRRVCPGAALCWSMCVNLFALGQYDKSSLFERWPVLHRLHLPATRTAGRKSQVHPGRRRQLCLCLCLRSGSEKAASSASSPLPPVEFQLVDGKKHVSPSVTFPKAAPDRDRWCPFTRSHGSVLFLVLTTHTDTELCWETHTADADARWCLHANTHIIHRACASVCTGSEMLGGSRIWVIYPSLPCVKVYCHTIHAVPAFMEPPALPPLLLWSI